ncbi:MAG: hypothetical protein KKH72_11550 [Alphaproteobacteria bacterium]|nr:hypothetical protein [Alphaproteobacteria bacterium]
MRVAFWLAFSVVTAVTTMPAFAAWTARPIDDGHGHAYFLASSTAADKTRAELFCNAEGVVNFALIWPDRQHPDAADRDEPATMSIVTDAGDAFEAKSYYWASGKGVLILDFGYPPQIRDLAAALGAARAEITVTVTDAARGIDRIAVFDAEGVAGASAAFLDWCPQPAD